MTTTAQTAAEQASVERAAGPAPGSADASADELVVAVDQDLCTGDGLCVLYAPQVFEFDIDGLAYVKGADGELRTDPGATAPVPANLVVEVLNSATDCPGECIHVRRASDGHAVGGPEAHTPQ